VYPGDMADAIEEQADELDTSISGLYKEAIRRVAQDPESQLDADAFEADA